MRKPVDISRERACQAKRLGAAVYGPTFRASTS